MLRGDGPPLPGLLLAAGVGALCALLVKLGNPGNMGICGACFLRDVTGSLKMIEKPRIFRPEVAGLMVGALAFVVARRRFAARSGSFAVTRFFFGVWMGIGTLVFLGCPFRMLQRIGGGDVNAVIAAVGFVAGVGLGHLFERRGYTVGRTEVVSAPIGLLGPATAVILLALFVKGMLAGPGPDVKDGPPHAPWLTAMGIAAAAGVALSATGFCAVSAARQIFLKRKRMLLGALLLIAGYAVVALATGKFKGGSGGQPIAHEDVLWNILPMVLVGLTGVLAGGCPVRQIVMAGEGNGDAFLTVAGIATGAVVAHNLGAVSSPEGPTAVGRSAVWIGLAVSIAYAIATTARRRA
ncbi:MAG TPA: YedE family putative selenium transporter [Planctomycetota bacterium]|nr:YedE family putative selenium transporter [Planctomycetota bacterium]